MSERTNFRLMFRRSILWCSLTLTLVPMHALPQTSRRITPSFELWPTYCRRVPVLGRRGSQRSRESNRYRWYLCPSPPLPLILSRPRSRSTVGMDLRLPTSCQEKRVGVGFAPDAALPPLPLRLLPFRVSMSKLTLREGRGATSAVTIFYEIKLSKRLRS